MPGSDDGTTTVGFDLPDDLFPAPGSAEQNGGLQVIGKIAAQMMNHDAIWHPAPFQGAIPDDQKLQLFTLSKTSPVMSASVLKWDKTNLIDSSEIPGGGNFLASENLNDTEKTLFQIRSLSLDRFTEAKAAARRIYIRFEGGGKMKYGFRKDGIWLFSPRLKSKGGDGIIRPAVGSDGTTWPEMHGRLVFGVEQFRGGSDPSVLPTGIMKFRNVSFASDQSEIQMEARLTIEGAGDDLSNDESSTELFAQAHDPKTGKLSKPVIVKIESNRTAYFSFPCEAVGDGNFDLLVKCLGPGHTLIFHGVNGGGSIQVVTGSHSFFFNLLLSLGILWLLSILVICTSVFCSTFVSWPIAVILTVVILLGHWGTSQIADSNAPGIGATQIHAQDCGIDLFTPPLIARHQLAAPFGGPPVIRPHARARPRKRRRPETRR